MIDAAQVIKEGKEALSAVKQKRTPRNYDSILKGALELNLADRVNLKKALSESIINEVDAAKQKAESYAKIAQE